MSSIKYCLPSNVIFNHRLSSIQVPFRLFSIKVHLQSNDAFHRSFFSLRLFSIKSYLLSNVVTHQMLLSIKCCYQSNVVLHQRLSSIKYCLPSNVIFNHRMSSIQVPFPSTLVHVQNSRLIAYFLLVDFVGKFSSYGYAMVPVFMQGFLRVFLCDRNKTKSTPSFRTKPGV